MGDEETTKQVLPEKDMNYNPTGKGGFGDHPENRSDGGWKKENVFSYQYKRFMNMTLDELNDWRLIPDMQRTVVEELAYNTVMRSKQSLPDVKEITDRTEGKPVQHIELATNENEKSLDGIIKDLTHDRNHLPDDSPRAKT